MSVGVWIITFLLLLTNPSSGLEIWNTFQDITSTDGREMIYDYRKSDISPLIEFERFPKYPPNTNTTEEGGVYNIDINITKDGSGGTIHWTLLENVDAPHMVLDNGTYDRYYLCFDDPLTNVDVQELSSEILVQTSIPVYEARRYTINPHQLLELPILRSECLIVEMLPGSNVTTTIGGPIVSLSFELERRFFLVEMMENFLMTLGFSP